MAPHIQLRGFVDLHAHTNASDGSFTPAELVAEAARIGLDALAITDHETFAGYEEALPYAREAGLDLVRGIELNTRLYLPDVDHPRDLHLLAYFPAGTVSNTFREWLGAQQNERRERNRKLAESLRRQDVDITLEEVEARGRSITGRPHFARLLVKKGYATDHEDAFRRYLGDEAPGFVERMAPATEEAIRLVLEGGGVPVVAHPVRLSLKDPGLERRAIAQLKHAGLGGLEVIHSDHSAALQQHYAGFAQEFDLLPTGGSDFHGTVKPRVALGRGVEDNVRVPRAFLERMRELR